MPPTTPPQEMTDSAKPSCGRWWLWALAIVVALVVIWLGVSWMRGWFPFSPPISEQQKILNSLTPPPGYKVMEIPQSVLDSLTPPASTSPKK